MNNVTHNYTLIKDCFQRFLSKLASRVYLVLFYVFYFGIRMSGADAHTSFTEPIAYPVKGTSSVTATVPIYCRCGVQVFRC